MGGLTLVEVSAGFEHIVAAQPPILLRGTPNNRRCKRGRAFYSIQIPYTFDSLLKGHFLAIQVTRLQRLTCRLQTEYILQLESSLGGSWRTDLTSTVECRCSTSGTVPACHWIRSTRCPRQVLLGKTCCFQLRLLTPVISINHVIHAPGIL